MTEHRFQNLMMAALGATVALFLTGSPLMGQPDDRDCELRVRSSTPSLLTPAGSYKDYALGRDASSFGSGLYGSKVLAVCDGFVKLRTADAVLLYMPFGWHSLTAPADCFEKYLGLMGLILRDRKIHWGTQAGTPQDWDSAMESNPFEATAEAALEKLVQPDDSGFVAMLSPNMIHSNGLETIRRRVRTTLLPFFVNYRGLGRSTTVIPDLDSFGNRGFSFYWTAATKNGEEKPFVVYTAKEAGRIVVAGLAINKADEDRH